MKKPAKSFHQIVPFSIERVDNLGQGVSFDKENDKITFIPKTLPGEKGEAQVIAAKGKKVQFAKLQSLQSTSEDRITPDCPHYAECSGCSFLHTNYEKESELKKLSYSFLFRKYFDANAIRYTQAPRRLMYRNRIQLHYNRKSLLLGYMGENSIISIPQCLLPYPLLQEKLKDLYENHSWTQLLDQNQPNQGHIELYLVGQNEKNQNDEKNNKDQRVSLAINERYAHDGFTQVFQEMNEKIIHSVDDFFMRSKIKELHSGIVIDLFGGDGNLSQKLGIPTLVVDYFTGSKLNREHQNFLSLNLYKDSALKDLMKYLGDNYPRETQISWLILDPPRSGLKNLDEYVAKLNPERISYLSCNPNTQVRDLNPLLENGWVIESIEFLDLFPSTHHLESFVHLKKAH